MKASVGSADSIVLVTLILTLGGCAGQECPIGADGEPLWLAHSDDRIYFRFTRDVHPECEYEVLAHLECVVEWRDGDPGPAMQEAEQCLLDRGRELGANAILDMDVEIENGHDKPRWNVHGEAIKYLNYQCRCGTGNVYY